MLHLFKWHMRCKGTTSIFPLIFLPYSCYLLAPFNEQYKKCQLYLQITSQFLKHIKWKYNNKLFVQLSRFLFTIGAWKLAQTDF